MTPVERTPALLDAVRSAPALLFDFDGTLAPNLDLAGMKAQVLALTRHWKVPDAEFAGAYIVEITELATAWLTRREGAASAERYARDAAKLIRDFELDAAADTGPFPAAPPLLAHWRKLGRASAVVTRNCRAAVLATYPGLDLHTDALLARDDVPHLKPDPRHLSLAIRQLEVEAAPSIMIGDGAMDMQIGRALGMYCLGVESGSNTAQALQGAGAHWVADHIGALLELVHEL